MTDKPIALPPLDEEVAKYLTRFEFIGGPFGAAAAGAATSYRLRRYRQMGASYPEAQRAAIWWTLPLHRRRYIESLVPVVPPAAPKGTTTP